MVGTLEAGIIRYESGRNTRRWVVKIFELRTAYHNSLANMRVWLGDTSLSGQLTVLDRLSILDAWQQEMTEFFERNGYCFACNRRLPRCECAESVEN